MERFKYLVAIALLGSPAVSFAQTANDGGPSSSGVEAWKGLRFSYDKIFINEDWGDDNEFDDYKKNGFTAGYEQAFRLSKKWPVFVQTGLDLSFTRLSDDGEEDGYSWKDKYSVLGLGIPVNFVYAFKFNDMLALKPYTGFYVRVNVWGQEKWTDEDSYGDGESDSEKYDLFDEEDMGGDDETCNRVQGGWQIGATLDVGRFNAGVGYALDFNEIAEKTKAGKFMVKVGCNF